MRQRKAGGIIQHALVTIVVLVAGQCMAAADAAAQTFSDLIPLCHPLPLTDCKVTIESRPVAADGSMEVVITCRAETHGQTGVEMEALTGASIAALTLYDMGKGISHEIVVGSIRLLEKTGGKSHFLASTATS